MCLAWPSAQQARDAARDVLADDAYQRELPVDAEAGPRGRGDPSSSGWGRRAGPPSVAAPIASGVAGLLKTIVWVVLGVVACAILFVFVRERQGAREHERRGGLGDDEDPRPELGVDVAALGDAEALAREGRFACAIHVLLLRTFEAIGRGASLPTSLTSREVLGHVPMSEAARAALGELVAAVEVSHFGGRDAGEADYRRCADRYRAVLRAHGVTAS